MSRTRAQAWIESGAVTVDGIRAPRASIRVAEGASVEVTLPDSAQPRTRAQPEPGDLAIVYEDEHLIALNKPAGIIVHPSYKHTSGTLLNAVLWHVRDRPAARPGIVSRLDKQTSGLLLVALSPVVHAQLQRQRIRKEYLALVVGTLRPHQGTIDLPLARDTQDRRRVVVTRNGAASTTKYEVLSTDRGISLVRCELVTGRTHQIRVHLASSGWPIVGDTTYGEKDARIARQALHSWRATFAHPVTGTPMQLTAPPPDDLRNCYPTLSTRYPPSPSAA
jgi:23S rRNA pseudouridine1911/1915/1917 synthase